MHRFLFGCITKFIWLIASFQIFATTTNVVHRVRFSEQPELYIPGNFLLGALLSAHAFESRGETLPVVCGEIQPYYVMVIETIRLSVQYANDRMLNDQGYQFGLWVLDDCDNPGIGIQSSVRFMAGQNLMDGICTSFVEAANDSRQLFGIVGSSGSAEAIFSAPLFSSFCVPLISAESTADELSKKSLYPYFLRTVPPDTYQAEAVVDLLLSLEFSPIVIAYEDTIYGRGLRDQIVKIVNSYSDQAENTKTDKFVPCIEEDIAVPTGKANFDNEINTLRNVQSRVVLVIMDFSIASQFFRQVNVTGNLPKFQWIGTDAWGLSDYVTEDMHDFFENSISTGYYRYPLPILEHFLDNLTYSQVLESKNPWLGELVEAQNCCKLDYRPILDIDQPYDKMDNCSKTCQFAMDDHIVLKDIQGGVDRAYFTFTAVMAYARAFEELRQKYCPHGRLANTTALCKDFYDKATGYELMEMLDGIVLEDDQLPWMFQFVNRSGPPLYTYYQYKKRDGQTPTYAWTPVGEWNLSISLNKTCYSSSDFRHGDCIANVLDTDLSRIYAKCRKTCDCCRLPVCKQYDDQINLGLLNDIELGFGIVGVAVTVMFGLILISQRRTALLALDCRWLTGISLTSIAGSFTLAIVFTAPFPVEDACLLRLPCMSSLLVITFSALLVKVIRMVHILSENLSVFTRSIQLNFLIIPVVCQAVMIAFWRVMAQEADDTYNQCDVVTGSQSLLLFGLPLLVSALVLLGLSTVRAAGVLYVDRERRNCIYACTMATLVMIILMFISLMLDVSPVINRAMLRTLQEIMILVCCYVLLIFMYGPNMCLLVCSPDDNNLTYLSQEPTGTTVNQCGQIWVLRPTTFRKASFDIIKRLLSRP